MNFRLLVTLLLLACSGCSQNVKLRGKVTFSDDGSPLSVGTIFFETDTYTARGSLDSNGTFDVGSLSKKDGLPPGHYRVSIRGALKETAEKDINGQAVFAPLIDERFTNGNTSGLSIDVSKETKNYDFQVDRYLVKSKK